MRGVRPAVALLIGFALLAPPARASEVTLTVQTRTDQRPCEPGGATGCPVGGTYDVRVDMPTVLVAGTGGADDLAVTVTPGTTTVSGPGTTAGQGCEQAAADEVRCTDPPPATASFPSGPETRPVLAAALGAGDDRLTLTGSSGQSAFVDGGDGADTLTLAFGVASGGAGDDVLTAGVAAGGAGDDQLTATGWFGRIDGGPGADRLVGDPAAPTTFTGGPGADVITAGSSTDDSIDESASLEPVVVDLTGAGRQGADLATGVENATGGGGADTLIGDAAGNRLDGGAGDDTISAGDGADLVRGGAGADTVDGGAGDDDLRGELGADRLRGGDGDDLLAGETDVGGDPPSGRGGLLDGGAGDDKVFGSVDPEAISGGAGDDEIVGGGGRDRIAAGAGNDTVFGRPGRARVDLGPGDDVMSSPYRERVACGAGADVVTLIDAAFLVPPDCERLDPFDLGRAVPRPRFVAPHSVAVALNGRCPDGAGRCRITVRIRGIGARTVRAHGRPRTVRLPFPRRRRGRPVVIALRAVTGKGRAQRAAIRLAL